MWGQSRFVTRARAGRVGLVAGTVAVGLLALGPRPASAAQGPTNDPGSSLQWHLDAIGAPTAWATATGKGATIAIVDTGIDLGHEDLQGGKIASSVSCLDTGGDAGKCVDGGQDDDGHGTHVAGIAAATGGNGIGVVGVAPDATLLAVKVLREDCGGLLTAGCQASGTASDVEAGIHWATDHGATVINLSLGSTTQSVFGPGFSKAIEYAAAHGVINVVAAGNDFILGSGFSNEPAIVVAATNRTGTKASYSDGVGAAHWALSAPGGEEDTTDTCASAPQGILSTFWRAGETNSYACLAGTSMAAPQVAGAAAILRSAGLSAQQTTDRLLSTAKDIGLPGPDSTYGSGMLDLAAASAGLAAGPQGATNPIGHATTPSTSPPSTQASTTSSHASELPSSTVAPLVQLPSTTTPTTRSQAAAVGLQGKKDDLPPAPVTAAVLLAGAVGASSGWMLIRGAGWARRTPDRFSRRAEELSG